LFPLEVTRRRGVR